MKKKHYEAIAAIIAEHEAGNRANVASIARCMASYFAIDNKNFDRVRFLQACGIEQQN